MANDYNMKQRESKCPQQSKHTIRLLAVASFQKYHGYERVIKGLAQYYCGQTDRKIELYLVGNGKEVTKYRKMVKKYGLEQYVLFCGRRVGAELDCLYNRMDIALGSFGLYKEGIYQASSLKVREYLAKGMPIISGCREDAFRRENTYKYYFGFPNDKTVIDMQLVVDFYRTVYEAGIDRDKIHREIREYAKKNVDLSVTMQPVMKYICS